MKTINILVKVPDDNCWYCQFHKDVIHKHSRKDCQGNEIVQRWKTTKCCIFNVELKGYKPCKDCENSCVEVEE